jgi:hypothetical protein
MAESHEANGSYEERFALYYPYIHIRSENWLKSALLAFQKVNRIVPYRNTLSDDEITQEYSELLGPDETPLLNQANFNTERVKAAQKYLFERLKQNEAALAPYTEGNTPDEWKKGDEAFQLHRLKILDAAFSDWLVEKKLAWNTREFEEHDTFLWLTMHPRLGAALMTVLALALAKENGFNVVTPSRKAHKALLANTTEHVLAKLLNGAIPPDDDLGGEVTVQELCQVVLMTGFDLTRLKPTDIRDMVRDGGKDLRKFYGKLSRLADNIPPEMADEERARRLKAKAEEVLEDWRGCTEKLPQLKESVKEAVTEKGLEKAVDAAKDAVVAGSFIHFLGGVPGIALAIVVKTASTMIHRHEAPYPFLNRIEKTADKSIGSLYVPQWRKLAS